MTCQIVYFQGNHACFEQHEHHLKNTGLRLTDVCRPTKDLNEIHFLNESSYNPFIWLYCKFFHLLRTYVLHLPYVPAYMRLNFGRPTSAVYQIFKRYMSVWQVHDNSKSQTLFCTVFHAVPWWSPVIVVRMI